MSRLRPLATAVLAALSVTVGGLLASPAAAAAGVTPVVGLLGPTSGQVQAMQGSRITAVSLPAGWDQLEPQQGTYNTALLDQLRSQLISLRSAGYQVTLDLGLQYPPSWVFSLPGQTRFVDQYGDAWHGSLSEDVPNAVFNADVRNAESDYIAHLAAALGPGLAHVRVGGLLSGELRYPPGSYNGHDDAIWDYDPVAQAAAPDPGWTPGTGTTAQISDSLSFYFGALTNYQVWLMRTVSAAFPGIDQQVMLPGWGLRPGMVDDAVATGMTDNSVAEVNGLISSGLDWSDQVAAIASTGIPATVYTTWLDAPQQSSTVQGIAPVDYLAQLAGQYGLPLAGENTGGGGVPALQLCLQRVQADHLTAMMYMSGGLIADGTAGVTLANLESAAAMISPAPATRRHGIGSQALLLHRE